MKRKMINFTSSTNWKMNLLLLFFFFVIAVAAFIAIVAQGEDDNQTDE